MLQTLKHPYILKLYDYSIIQSKEDPDRVEINLLLQYFPVCFNMNPFFLSL